MKLYLISKNDEYELPVFCGTSKEAAEFLGVNRKTIYQYVFRSGKKNEPREIKIEIIQMEEDMEDKCIKREVHPCAACVKYDGDKEGCPKFRRCRGWRHWFSGQWKEIQKSAEEIRHEHDETA